MRNFIVLVLLCTCHAVEEQQQPTQQHQPGQQQQQVQSAQHYPHIQQQPQINYPQQPTHYPYPPYRPQSQQKMPAIPQQQSTDGVQQHNHQQGHAPYHTQTTTHQIVISEVKQLVPHYPEPAAESGPPHIISDKVQQLQQHVKEVMHQVGHHIPQVIKYQQSLQQNVPQSGHHNHVGVPSLSQETETAGVQQLGTQQHHVAIGMTQQHASQTPEGQSLKRDRRATPTTQNQKVPQQQQEQQQQQQNQQLSGSTKKTRAVKGPAASTTKAPIISQEQDKTQNRVTKTMPQQQQSLKSLKKTRALNTPTTTATKSSNVVSTTHQHEQQQQENVVKRTRRAVQSTVSSTITTPTPIHVHQPLIKKVSQSDGHERKQRGVFEPPPQQQHHQHKPNHDLRLTKPPHPTKCQHDHHVTQPPKSKPQDVHHVMDHHQQHLPQHIMPPFKPYGGDHAMPPYHEHPKVESHHEDYIFPGHHHEMYPHSDHFH